MRPRVPASRSTRLGIVLAALVIMTVPTVALASHIWNDVADGNAFHTDTAAIGLAGISTGCGGGNFCPDQAITRAQEAAFLHRGLGRVARDTQTGVLAPDTDTTAASLTITPGYTSGKIAGANGFLKIDGAISFYEDVADGCDCFFSVDVYVDGVWAGATQYLFLANRAGDQLASGAITTAYSVSANGPRTVELVVNEYVGTENISYYASMTAMYVPFGSTGIDVMSDAGAGEQPVGPRPGE